jgi:hypothetical protein
MPGISRRRFLRDASLGAVAVGTVAALGPAALGSASASASALPGATGAGLAGALSSARPRAEGEVMAHVVDAAKGTIAIYSGTTKVTIDDRAVAQALLKALA